MQTLSKGSQGTFVWDAKSNIVVFPSIVDGRGAKSFCFKEKIGVMDKHYQTLTTCALKRSMGNTSDF
jgi:hypothetical protein